MDEMIGQRFGRLEVIEQIEKRGKFGEIQYKCLCDCGNVRTIAGQHLRSHNSQSCGCKQREFAKSTAKNIVGDRFGRLVVIERAGSSHRRQATWVCQCNCGNKCVVTGAYLQLGRTRSCGCQKSEQTSERSLLDISGHRFGKLTAIERLSKKCSKETMWRCVCDCGREAYIRTNDLRTGKTQSCGCIKSVGELMIADLLDKSHISYQRQKVFISCINKTQLRFDFYLPEHNAVIEFHGAQHYEVNSFFGGEEGFASTQKRDRIKKEYCYANDIVFIEIPFTMNEHIEDILRDYCIIT